MGGLVILLYRLMSQRALVRVIWEAAGRGLWDDSR